MFRYQSFLTDLGLDLIAIGLLAYVVYYRHHRRRDLLLAYVALNVGLFSVVSMIEFSHASLALGFGLFAILSIIRLRSDTITQEEVAYYFVVLVLGLVNGLRIPDRWLTLMIDATLISIMYIADNRLLLPRSQHRLVTLDLVHADEASLTADLERRLGGQVTHCIVTEVDYVRDITVVDVRFLTPSKRSRVREEVRT